jgi:glycosyltransferase involved in cell wall biosynthesis
MALVRAVDGKKCSLIPCGVALSDDQLQTREEARSILGWNKGEKKVLFAGMYADAVKEPELAKQAMALLDNVQLVELKGYTRDQVNALMYSCDALLMTSKTEGSPQVVKEAMACGCPIVSVDVGDVAERTEGVDGGFVVKSREPREIAAAIEKALVFKGRTNGRDKIIEFGLTNELVAKQIIETYEDIINK